MSLPQNVIILIAVFGWSFLKTLGAMSRQETSGDRMLLQKINLGWLAPIFLYAGVGLQVVSLWYLVRPAPITTTICLTSIGLSVATTCIVLVLSLCFPQVYQEAGVASRESRGLPPRSEVIQFAGNRIVITGVSAFILFLHWVMISLVFSSQPYFDSFAG